MIKIELIKQESVVDEIEEDNRLEGILLLACGWMPVSYTLT